MHSPNPAWFNALVERLLSRKNVVLIPAHQHENQAQRCSACNLDPRADLVGAQNLLRGTAEQGSQGRQKGKTT